MSDAKTSLAENRVRSRASLSGMPLRAATQVADDPTIDVEAAFDAAHLVV